MAKVLLALALFAPVVLAGVDIENFDQPDDGYVAMPGGSMRRDCVHPWGDKFQYTEEGSNAFIRQHDGSEHILTASCSGRKNGYARLEAASMRGALAQQSEEQLGFSYFSNWIALAKYTHSTEIRHFSLRWKVPPKPAKTTWITTTFLFPGMEDVEHEASLILQPVLQYGFSGCGGGEHWYFGSYLVSGSGRAHCGKLLRVNEGDVLVGNITRSEDGSWDVISHDITTGRVSKLNAHISVNLLFASITLEGIRVYSCGAMPNSKESEFEVLALEDEKGDIRMRWDREIRHNECGQDVFLDNASKKITIRYSNATQA